MRIDNAHDRNTYFPVTVERSPEVYNSGVFIRRMLSAQLCTFLTFFHCPCPLIHYDIQPKFHVFRWAFQVHIATYGLRSVAEIERNILFHDMTRTFYDRNDPVNLWNSLDEKEGQ